MNPYEVINKALDDRRINNEEFKCLRDKIDTITALEEALLSAINPSSAKKMDFQFTPTQYLKIMYLYFINKKTSDIDKDEIEEFYEPHKDNMNNDDTLTEEFINMILPKN
jgi:hypothetical protein